jgi:N-ethylmaleimide reductase
MRRTLFEPARLGALQLKNRVVMAPMTRSRAIEANTPNMLMAEYYAQRATAGLIIAEGTSPSPNGVGYARMPGIYTSAHVSGWQQVTTAVHAAGGKIVLQTMHTGRVGHAANLPEGGELVGPGGERAPGEIHTDALGMQPPGTPRPLQEQEVEAVIEEFRQSAILAMDAGFDGVELHAGGGYLLEAFFNPHINQRHDAFGGSAAARNRLIVSIARSVTDAIGAGRVGVRFMPHSGANGASAFEGMDEQYVALAGQLSGLGLMYMHLVNFESMGLPALPADLREAMQRAFKGPLILGGGFGRAEAEQALMTGQADFISFGRPVLANPDFVHRLQNGAELNAVDFSTFYTPGAQGYTDYPKMEQA